MKYLALLVLVGCQGIKIASVGEAEVPEPAPEQIQIQTIGEPIDAQLPKLPPILWVLVAAGGVWLLIKED